MAKMRQKSDRRWRAWLPVGPHGPGFGFWLIVGSCVTAMMVVRALDTSVPLDAPTVQGEVVRIQGGKHDWIEVEYTLPDGRRLKARTPEYHLEDEVKGRKVVVRYDPGNPSDIAIGAAQRDKTVYWIIAGAFGLVPLASLIGLIVSRLTRRKAD